MIAIRRRRGPQRQRPESLPAGWPATSSTKGARIEYLWLPDDRRAKPDSDDYLAEHTVDDLMRLVKPTQPAVRRRFGAVGRAGGGAETPKPVIHRSHWPRFTRGTSAAFGPRYDLDAVNMTLAVAAVEKLDGDPVWLLIVSGSGAAKTETIMPLGNCAGAVIVSTISSEGAFLSATGKHDRSADCDRRAAA